jgi:glycosyltransferase involved in cell wall biosynthesis
MKKGGLKKLPLIYINIFNPRKNNLVDVCVITYNQQNYILNCLDSVLEQRLNEKYNIIVSDDSSTDGTSKLLTEHYSEFKNVYIHVNMENTGVSKNFLSCIYQSTAKYVSICEGDDFWNDRFKLQKQVEILEKNPDCSFCFTDVSTIENDKVTGVHPNLGKKILKFTSIDLADQAGSIAQTCSLVIRRQYLERLPDWVLKSYTLDWCLQLYLSKFGPAIYLPEVTATYRIHEKGIWSKLSPFEGWRKNLAFYKTALRQLPDKSSKKRLLKRIRNTINDALELANIQADKAEIRGWLWQKFITCPLVSVRQTLHSLRLLLA